MASTTKVGGTASVPKKIVSSVTSSVLPQKRILLSSTNSASAPKTVTSKLTRQSSTPNPALSNSKVSEARKNTPEKITKTSTSPVSKSIDHTRPKVTATSPSSRTPLSSPVKDTPTRSPVNVKQVGTILSNRVKSSSLVKDTTVAKVNAIASPNSKSPPTGATAVGGVRIGVTGVNKTITKVTAKSASPSSPPRTSSGTAVTKTASSSGITKLENSPVRTSRTKIVSSPLKTTNTISPVKTGITALSPVKTGKTTMSPVKSAIKALPPIKTVSSMLSPKTSRPTLSTALSKTNDLKDKNKLIVRRSSVEAVKKSVNILKRSTSSDVQTVLKQVPDDCNVEYTSERETDLDNTLVELELLSSEPASSNEEKCFSKEEFSNAVTTVAPVVTVGMSQDMCVSIEQTVNVFENTTLSTAASLVPVNILEDTGVSVETSSFSVSVSTSKNDPDNDSLANEGDSNSTVSQIAPIIAEETHTILYPITLQLSDKEEKTSSIRNSVQIYPVCGQRRSLMPAGLSYADVLKYQISNTFQLSSKANTTKIEYSTSATYENDIMFDKKGNLDRDFPLLKGGSLFTNRTLNTDVASTGRFNSKTTNENGCSFTTSNSVLIADKVDETKNFQHCRFDCTKDDKDEYFNDDYYDNYGLNENQELFDCKQNNYNKKVNNRKRMKRYMKKFEKKILGETITATCEVEASIFIAPVWKNIYSSCIASTD